MAKKKDKMTIEEKAGTDRVQPRDYIPLGGLLIRRRRGAINDWGELDLEERSQERKINEDIVSAISNLGDYQTFFVASSIVIAHILINVALPFMAADWYCRHFGN